MFGISTALENGTRRGIENAVENALNALDMYEVYFGMRDKSQSSPKETRQQTKAGVQPVSNSEYISKTRWLEILLLLFATIISQTGLYCVSNSSMAFILDDMSSDKITNPFYATVIIGIFWSVHTMTIWKLFKQIQTKYFENLEKQMHKNLKEQLKVEMEEKMLQELEKMQKKLEEQISSELEKRMESELNEMRQKMTENERNVELEEEIPTESEKSATRKGERVLELKSTMRMVLGRSMRMALGGPMCMALEALNDKLGKYDQIK